MATTGSLYDELGAIKCPDRYPASFRWKHPDLVTCQPLSFLYRHPGFLR
jgi:hypothetical protein